MDTARRLMSYQKLVDEAAEIRARKKIIFNPNDSTESLEKWLEDHKPSKIYRKDGIGWIVALTKSAVLPDISYNIERLQAEWEIIKNSKQPITDSTIQELAVKYNDTIGKWIIPSITSININYIWALVADSLVNGTLSKYCLYGKVKPRDCSCVHCQHTISVYNENFTNTEVLSLIEKELRNLGITSRLFYKTDASTHCRIYPNNKWRLPSSIYVSIYDEEENVSKIQSCLSTPTHEKRNQVKVKMSEETRAEDTVSNPKSGKNAIYASTKHENGINKSEPFWRKRKNTCSCCSNSKTKNPRLFESKADSDSDCK